MWSEREKIQQSKIYERNFRSFGEGLARFAGGVVRKEGGVSYHASPTQNVFNACLPGAWTKRDARTKMRRLLQMAADNQMGLGVILGPSCPAGELRAFLLENKIRCGYWVPFFAADLGSSAPKREVPSHVSLEWQSDLDVFKRQAHPSPGKLTTKQRKAEWGYHNSLVRSGKAWSLAAWQGDQVVGTALLVPKQQSVAIYNVAVFDEDRKKGIGSAMMRESLRFAKQQGMRSAVLSAASKAVPLYQRVGFELVGEYGSYYIGKARLQQLVAV